MKKMKIVIVGGVAGGASAAVRARRLSETAEIIMLEKGSYVSFANCGLPYHIGGDIPKRESLVLKTPEDFQQRFEIDVRLQHEALSIDTNAKTLQIKNALTGNIYTESWDRLLLSTGASPVVPPMSGVHRSGVFTLRSLSDMDNILAHIERRHPQHATVVGGGFIGLEVMEALSHRGIAVTLLEQGTQVMASVDAEMAEVLHQEIRQHDIDLRLRTGLTEIAQTNGEGKLHITLNNGEALTTDMVVLAIGVKPELTLARNAELAIGQRGGIQVDEYMETSVPGIYAVGDVVETTEWVTGTPTLIPLAGPANRQGRIAAENMLGGKRRYPRSQGTAICKVFDYAIASVGLNEKALQRDNLRYEKVFVHAADHASYYPGSQPISLKLLFEPVSGTILGAQAVGKRGIDKTIDVLAVAQRAGLSVDDLENLEFAYAPPFNGARSVVNQIGMVASNVLHGGTRICHVDDIQHLDPERQVLVDVRTREELKNLGEFGLGLHIPLDELRQRINELPKNKEILIACQSGLRGHVAWRILTHLGFQARNLTGGYKTWLMVNASH